MVAIKSSFVAAAVAVLGLASHASADVSDVIDGNNVPRLVDTYANGHTILSQTVKSVKGCYDLSKTKPKATCFSLVTLADGTLTCQVKDSYPNLINVNQLPGYDSSVKVDTFVLKADEVSKFKTVPLPPAAGTCTDPIYDIKTDGKLYAIELVNEEGIDCVEWCNNFKRQFSAIFFYPQMLLTPPKEGTTCSCFTTTTRSVIEPGDYSVFCTPTPTPAPSHECAPCHNKDKPQLVG